jgi:rubrerythrin
MQLSESTDNKLAVEVLKDIADEERVHAGEFLRLLKELPGRLPKPCEWYITK